MVITPKDAALLNDEKVIKEVKAEEARIDAILVEKYHSDGPPVDIVESKISGLAHSRLKQLYHNAGWRIEVRTALDGKSIFWRFSKL